MTAVEELPCPECGRLLGDHTVNEFKAHTDAGRHTDYAPVDDAPVELDADGMPLYDHIIVKGGHMEGESPAGTVVYPLVIFTFGSSAGAAPVTAGLLGTEETFGNLRRLVAKATGDASLWATQRARQIKRGDS